MSKICPKCGYIRKPEDIAPSEDECPKCGIVYHKFEASLKKSRPQSERPKQDGISVECLRIIIAMPFLIIGLYFFWRAWDEGDSTIIMIGIWPTLFGLWLCGAEVSSDDNSTGFGCGGDDGSDGGDGGGD